MYNIHYATTKIKHKSDENTLKITEFHNKKIKNCFWSSSLDLSLIHDYARIVTSLMNFFSISV